MLVYTRTIRIPKDVVLTGALIKIATVLTISGDVEVFGNDGLTRLTGYHVLAGAAGRKQAYLALQDTYVTMSFATKATTIEEVEEEFTDEAALLLSRRQGDGGDA